MKGTESIVYKMSDVIGLSDDFQKKFSVLVNLEVGEKLAIYEGCLCKDASSTYVQPITRWWGNQGRENNIKYIDNEIESYTNYLRFVRGAHFSVKCAQRDREHLLRVYNEHTVFIETIIKGLEILKQTYSDSSNIVKKLEALVKKLKHIPKLN